MHVRESYLWTSSALVPFTNVVRRLCHQATSASTLEASCSWETWMEMIHDGITAQSLDVVGSDRG